jgi:hypothetical protein
MILKPMYASTFQAAFCYIFMKGVKKCNLPEKICPVCSRPFSWRKKWEKHWADVKYCSDRCRQLKGKTDIADVN